MNSTRFSTTSTCPTDPTTSGSRSSRAAQLNSGQFETRYLIEDVLAAGQPGGIFGAFRDARETSLTADLLISLASGTPFLGQFPVARAGPHAVSLGRIGPGCAAIDRPPHLPGARAVARGARQFRALARTCRGSIGRPTCGRCDESFASKTADLRRHRSGLSGDRRRRHPQPVRDRLALASAGRTVRDDRLHGSRRPSLQALAANRPQPGHARRHRLGRLRRVLGPMARCSPAAAVRPGTRPARAVALRRGPQPVTTAYGPSM